MSHIQNNPNYNNNQVYSNYKYNYNNNQYCKSSSSSSNNNTFNYNYNNNSNNDYMNKYKNYNNGSSSGVPDEELRKFMKEIEILKMLDGEQLMRLANEDIYDESLVVMRDINNINSGFGDAAGANNKNNKI
ncbi:4726_t:CDS:2, partial [Entrophospora sp. SA101]